MTAHVALFVGRLEQQKGLDELLEAALESWLLVVRTGDLLAGG